MRRLTPTCVATILHGVELLFGVPAMSNLHAVASFQTRPRGRLRAIEHGVQAPVGRVR